MTASLPSGYVEADRWDLGRVSGRQRLGALALSFVAVFVTMGIGLGAVSLTGGEATLRVDLPRVLVGGLLGLVLHELSHAAAFLALGGRPRFGGKVWTRLGPVLSVSAPGAYLTRGAYLFAGVGAVLVLGVVLIGVGAVAPEGGRSPRSRSSPRRSMWPGPAATPSSPSLCGPTRRARASRTPGMAS